jgi:DNA-binding NarL/FixJ family response regulator
VEIYGQDYQNIDLVLLDLIMPGMGGIKCLQTMVQKVPSVKILIISGYVPDEQAMQIINACTGGYLRKPYTGEQLLSAVRRVLDSD